MSELIENRTPLPLSKDDFYAILGYAAMRAIVALKRGNTEAGVDAETFTIWLAGVSPMLDRTSDGYKSGVAWMLAGGIIDQAKATELLG